MVKTTDLVAAMRCSSQAPTSSPPCTTCAYRVVELLDGKEYTSCDCDRMGMDAADKMEESPELVVSQWTLGEMVVFVYDAHGKPQAAVGEHDDLVMAAAITHTARTQQRYTAAEDAADRKHWTADMWEDWRRADPETRKYLEKRWGAR